MQFAHYQSCSWRIWQALGSGSILWRVTTITGTSREEEQPQKLLHGWGLASSDTRMTWISDPPVGCFSALVLENSLIVHLSTFLGRQTFPSSEKASLQVWNNVWRHFSFCIPGEIFSFFENIKKYHYLTSMDMWTSSPDVKALLLYHRAKIQNPVCI